MTVALARVGLVCVAVGVAAACGVRGSGAQRARVSDVASHRTAPSTSSNRRLAVRDAARLLRGVVPPNGAIPQSSGTAIGAHAQLLTTATASAVAYRSWRARGDPESVLSFVQAHLPAGSKLVSSGSGGPTLELSVIRSWPPVNGILNIRWLYIGVTARAKGGTELYAKSQSEWVITRPAGEHVPGGVREVDITEGWPGKSPFLSRRVTSMASVHKLVALFNSLGTLQPGSINCPADTPTPTVTFDFRAGGTSTPVARATVSAVAYFSWPANLPGWACFPVSLEVGGRSSTPLAGNVITPTHNLLHIKLAWSH